MNKYKFIHTGNIECKKLEKIVESVEKQQSQRPINLKFEDIFSINDKGILIVNEHYLTDCSQQRSVHTVRTFSTGEIAELVPSRSASCNLTITIPVQNFDMRLTELHSIECRIDSMNLNFLIMEINVSTGIDFSTIINISGSIR